VLLRGGNEAQLVRVKRVVRFLALAAFNARLEAAFLAAETTAALAAVGEEGEAYLTTLAG
jgi:hypothetical protein